jgi:hypothetical protein
MGCAAASGDVIHARRAPNKKQIQSSTGNQSQAFQPQTQEILLATPVRPISFEGTAAEMGQQHGSLLKQDIINVQVNWLNPIRNLIPFLIEAFISAKSSKLVGHLPADFLIEIRALASAAGLTEGEKPVLLGNLTPDLMAMAQRPLGCSTFVVMPERSKTGGMIFGRNLDYAFSEYLRGQWRPMIFRKPGKHAVLSIGVPGVIGVISGLNSQGVAMTINMSSTSDPYSTDGVGALAIFRAVLEEANSAAHARDLYNTYRRTVAINVTITDGTSAYILEATPSRSKFRSPSKGVLYAANHYVYSDLGNGKKPDFRWPILQSKDNTTDALGLADVRTIIASTGVEKTNVLAFILDYAGKKLYFGSDKSKAIAGNLKVIDVSEFIKD